MSYRNKFFKNGIMLTLVGLAARTVAMFFGAFISRTIGAEGVGLYTVIMTVYSFAVTFATSGISLTVTRHIASAIGEERGDELGKILRGALLYSLLFSSVATLFLFFGAEIIGVGILNDSRSIPSFKVLAFSLIPLSLGSVFSGYFIGVKRVGFNAAVSVFAQLLKITLTVGLVIKSSKNGMVESVVALCLGITLTEALGFLMLLAEYLYDRRKHSQKNEKKGGGELASVSKTALPLAFSAYVRSVLLTAEHILIPKRLRDRGESSAESYAHYGILHGMALPLILYPMAPLSSFSGLLVPEFAEDSSSGRCDRMSRIASDAMNKTLIYASVLAVMIYIFAEELGYVIYKSYEAGYYIAMLATVIPIMYLDHVTDSMLKGVGEHVFSMWVNITDSLLSVALVWCLIPKMGILGYAVVIIIMEAYNFTLSVVRLSKRVRFEISPLSSALLPSLSAVVSGALTRELFRFGGSAATTFGLIIKIVFAIAVFVAIFLPTYRVLVKREPRITLGKNPA